MPLGDGYIVVVPMHDEEGSLPGLMECIDRQMLPPSLVLLIDDGSMDGTAAVAERYITDSPLDASSDSSIPRVQIYRVPRHAANYRRIGAAIRGGFRFLSRCGVFRGWGGYGFMGADIRVAPRYFEELYTRMEEMALGSVSGALAGESNPLHMARGGAQLVSRKVMDRTRIVEIPDSSPDSYLNYKAHATGYPARCFRDKGLEVATVRPTHVHSARRRGLDSAMFRRDPLTVAWLAVEQGRTLGAPGLWGYVSGYLSGCLEAAESGYRPAPEVSRWLRDRALERAKKRIRGAERGVDAWT